MIKQYKMYSKIVVLLSVLFSGFLGHSQNYIEKTEQEKVNLKDATQDSSQQLFGLGDNQQDSEKLENLTGKSLYLKQVGDYNQVRVRAAANSSEINILQNGDDNFVNMEYNVNKVSANVQQNGNDNIFKDYVYGERKNVSVNLQQNGDDMYFERFGANEMSKNIKFKQSEASPTIIVRSFK